MNSCHFAGIRAFRVILIVLALLSGVLLLAGCGGAGTGAASKASDQIPIVLDQQEYLLYQNIFYNGYGSQYDGKTVTKQGVFAVLKDAFSKRDRYYVWGYLDQTKCCDWQWEFVPEDPDHLPPVGSEISVEGIFVSNEDALDSYWIDNAKVKTLTEFTGKAVELNMRAMSDTLERVQVINIIRIPDSFQNTEFMAYGRIASAGILQDPYYDGSWQIPYTSDAEVPAIGTLVILDGHIVDGVFADCSLEVTA